MADNPDKTSADNETPARVKRFSLRKLLGRVMLVALAIVIVNSVINANQNFSNRFKEGFYFEKYSNAKQVRAALLKLHPIGSDIEALRRSLEKAGAKQDLNYTSRVAYGYTQNTESYLYKSLWQLDINVDYASSTKVQNISVSMMGAVK